ncbi:hypothetical protein ACSBR2_014105 [Camellia fascicularis]
MPNSAQGSRTLYILVVGCIPFYGSTKSGPVNAGILRTIDVLAARLYFYYSLSYELTSDLAEIWGFVSTNNHDVDNCFISMTLTTQSNAHSIGVQSQLSTLAGIMKVVDPKLHQHLGMADPARILQQTN